MNKVSLNNGTELNWTCLCIYLCHYACNKRDKRCCHRTLFSFPFQAKPPWSHRPCVTGKEFIEHCLGLGLPSLTIHQSTCHPRVRDLLPWLTSTLFPANPCTVSKHRHPSHDHPGCMQSESTFITFHPSLNQRTPTHTETFPSQSCRRRKANRMRLGGPRWVGRGWRRINTVWSGPLIMAELKINRRRCTLGPQLFAQQMPTPSPYPTLRNTYTCRTKRRQAGNTLLTRAYKAGKK